MNDLALDHRLPKAPSPLRSELECIVKRSKAQSLPNSVFSTPIAVAVRC
jgi:hypothetical protein